MSDDGQGFITPPPGIAPAPKREAEPEAVTAPAEESQFISLPPGVSAPEVDSGTHRVEGPRRGRSDAPVFFPTGAPGLPAVAPPTEPTPAVPAPASEIDEATRVGLGRRAAPAWRITLADGEQALVERTTLVGRSPAAHPQWPDAEILAIADPAKSVSKTHAVLVVAGDGGLTVHDLDSTNGTYLGAPGRDEVEVLPGEPRPVETGAELGFGEYTVTVVRA